MLGTELGESEAEDGKQGGELVHQMDAPRLEEPEIELRALSRYKAGSLLNACACMLLAQVCG